MFESLASCFAFSLQRFAQFATGRIRRGGHDNAVYDSKIASLSAPKAIFPSRSACVSSSFEYPWHFAVSYLSRNLHMHLRLVISLTISALITPAIFAQVTNPPTVDELVAKNIEAKGGATALNSLQSLRLSGKLLVPVQGRIELAYLQTKKRPDEVRTEASLQGMTQIEAYDGKEGWKVSPFFGRKDPERMSADDIKALVEDTEMGGPLADWKAKGSTVEYLGTEDVDGTPAHKLKVVRKNGDVSFVYLDPDHFLEIRIVTQRMRHGAHEEVETDLGDYEKAGGVFVPTSIESGRKGAPDKQVIVIDKLEANAPVDDAVFHFPASK
jgi:hypothetical protein